MRIKTAVAAGLALLTVAVLGGAAISPVSPDDGDVFVASMIEHTNSTLEVLEVFDTSAVLDLEMIQVKAGGVVRLVRRQVLPDHGPVLRSAFTVPNMGNQLTQAKLLHGGRWVKPNKRATRSYHRANKRATRLALVPANKVAADRSHPLLC